MIQKIANFEKWKKYLLIGLVVLSFALNKSIIANATQSINGMFLSLLFLIGVGFFHWLVFEVLIGFFYSGLKEKIEKNITLNQFNNLFRFGIMFVNILLFGLSKLIIMINFYANYILLICSLIFMFVYLLFMWLALKKYFLNNLKDNKLELTYFGFVFMFLFLHTIMWGVM